MSFYTRGAGSAGSADKLPRALLRKLEALSYPDLGSASLGGDAYCKIVLWLEEEKIRFFEPNQRKGLREFGEAWLKLLAGYAKELGVPADRLAEGDAAAKLRVLSGLVNLAIHDVYRDRVEDKSIVLAPPPKPVAGGVDDRQHLQDIIPSLNQLLDQYSLPKLLSGAIDTDTVAALRCVRTRLCHKGKSAVDLDLQQLPVAVEVGDPEVKKAAGMLRLLHNIEMGQLQVNVNQVLNELQQLTANPKTDARLGRVGT